ncbi:hypothetical protein AOCH_005193 [Aspergillus ochraceoroseus]|uniref:acylphosphatase n=1 Tax=Aspergillus ochraceoroseus TaxID=138278 RepID=A0A0F8W8M2_9EURO|nr:hypothetical protein AOCH_005193 [Aspergillus ochraceoroseus]
MKRIAFKVSGTVQEQCFLGVGFRDFTRQRASEYALRGWVKNTPCGRVVVEGEAQGPEESIQKFVQDLDKGPRLAHVVKLEKKELEVKGDDDEEGHFGVKRTSETIFESL